MTWFTSAPVPNLELSLQTLPLPLRTLMSLPSHISAFLSIIMCCSAHCSKSHPHVMRPRAHSQNQFEGPMHIKTTSPGGFGYMQIESILNLNAYYSMCGHLSIRCTFMHTCGQVFSHNLRTRTFTTHKCEAKAKPTPCTAANF